MQKSKDMITSQLPKVTCYNKVVKKGNTSNNSLYIYILSQIQLISSLQNTGVEDGGKILNLWSDYWSTNPVRLWYLCAVIMLVLGWNERHEITIFLISTCITNTMKYIQCLKLDLYNHHDHSINYHGNFDCQFGWYTPTQLEYSNDQFNQPPSNMNNI